jgi:hypothetical protein
VLALLLTEKTHLLDLTCQWCRALLVPAACRANAVPPAMRVASRGTRSPKITPRHAHVRLVLSLDLAVGAAVSSKSTFVCSNPIMAVVTCPAFSSGTPCVCGAGYSSTLSWNSGTQSYNGGCALVSCPSGAAGAPTCACQQGSSGVIAWNAVTQMYTGTCSGKPNAMPCSCLRCSLTAIATLG